MRIIHSVTPRPDDPPPSARPGVVGRAYLLGTVPVAAADAHQRRLVYEVSGDPATAAVLVCDHPAGVTIGRDGSVADIRLSAAELTGRNWPVTWAARGGGVHVHAAGQVCCYGVLSLNSVGLTPAGFAGAWVDILVDLARSFGLSPARDAGSGRVPPGARLRGRRFAQLGIAVRRGVTSGGVIVNVGCDLDLFREVDADGDPRPMTSLQREGGAGIRVPAVRQRLLDLVAARFGFRRLSVFTTNPTFPPRTSRHAFQPARD